VLVALIKLLRDVDKSFRQDLVVAHAIRAAFGSIVDKLEVSTDLVLCSVPVGRRLGRVSQEEEHSVAGTELVTLRANADEPIGVLPLFLWVVSGGGRVAVVELKGVHKSYIGECTCNVTISIH